MRRRTSSRAIVIGVLVAIFLLPHASFAADPPLGRLIPHNAASFFEQQEVMLERQLAEAEARHGRNHVEVAKFLSALAGLYLQQQRYHEATPLLVRAFRIFQSHYAASAPDVAVGLEVFADALEDDSSDCRRKRQIADAQVAIKRLTSSKETHAKAVTGLAEFGLLFMFNYSVHRDPRAYGALMAGGSPEQALAHCVEDPGHQARSPQPPPLGRPSIGDVLEYLEGFSGQSRRGRRAGDEDRTNVLLGLEATLEAAQGNSTEAQELYRNALEGYEEELQVAYPALAQHVATLRMALSNENLCQRKNVLVEAYTGFRATLPKDHHRRFPGLRRTADMMLMFLLREGGSVGLAMQLVNQGRLPPGRVMGQDDCMAEQDARTAGTSSPNEELASWRRKHRRLGDLMAALMGKMVIPGGGHLLDRSESLSAGDAARLKQRLARQGSVVDVDALSISARRAAQDPAYEEPIVSADPLWDAEGSPEWSATRPNYYQLNAIIRAYEAVLERRQAAPDKPRLAVAHNNLAVALALRFLEEESISDLKAAASHLMRAINLFEEHGAADLLATASHNQGILLLEIEATPHRLTIPGSTEATGLQRLRRALELREAAVPANLRQQAETLSGLAAAHVDRGELTKARVYAERSLALRRQAGMPTGYATVRLAELSLTLGDKDGAERLLRLIRANADTDGELSPLDMMPDGATFAQLMDGTSRGRTLLKSEPADKAAAMRYYRNALDHAENTWRPKVSEEGATTSPDPRGIDIMNFMTALSWLREDLTAARRDLAAANRRVARFISDNLPRLSLAEQLAFINAQIPFQISLSFSLARDGEALATAYDQVLAWKGLLLDVLRREEAALARLERSDATASDRAALGRLRAELAHLYYANKCDDPAVRSALVEKTRDKEALERRLKNLVEPARITMTSQALDLSRLQSLLADDEALIDIYRYEFWSEAEFREARYAAIVTSSGSAPSLIDLGAAQAIDQAIDGWLSGVATGVDAGAWERLKALVWKPVEAELPAAAERVWLSPDHTLALIPWHLFATAVPRPLLLSQIDSSRGLARLRALQKSHNSAHLSHARMLLVGGVDYDANGEGFSADGHQPFPFLPETLQEIDDLSRIAAQHGIAAATLRGGAATVGEVVGRLRTATYVHLATHGFVKEICLQHEPAGQTVSAETTLEQAQVAAQRNPLMAAGLALAGANTATKDGQPGILLAEQLLGLQFPSADLVTLSACKTASGLETAGQGVLGLQTAVLGAGARSLLMSLWEVSSPATALFMRHFYAGLWRDGMSKAEALRHAQAAMRADDSGFSAPGDWAAWVLVGEAW